LFILIAEDKEMAKLRCRYQNTTDSFQIIVMSGLERVLLPNMAIEFDALLEDTIAVKDGLVTAINADNVSCQQLMIK
jgi:hypothetical protein